MLFGYLRFDQTPERWPKHCATDAAPDDQEFPVVVV
jgi:hypothetical protein